ncbi:hypothetical protein BDW71DRAFT_178371 [Aspergillus fruticulosus]
MALLPRWWKCQARALPMPLVAPMMRMVPIRAVMIGDLEETVMGLSTSPGPVLYVEGLLCKCRLGRVAMLTDGPSLGIGS